MRRFVHIFTIALIAMSLSGCDTESTQQPSYGNDININIDTGNYITFQTETDTRGELVESKYIPGDFGVYGYQYDFGKNWNGQRAIALPNVFWNEVNNVKVPLKVSDKSGYYEYNASNAEEGHGGQINWTSNKYAFFAYYPYEATKITPSSMTAEGAPYIEYTVDRATSKNHVDVMTGGLVNATSAGSNNTVTFTMSHRLSGVDVSICNAYSHNYSDENGTVYTETVDIEISELTLDFDNIDYDYAKIYLEDGWKNPDPENKSVNKKANYKIIGEGSDSGEPSYDIEPTTTENTIVTKDLGCSMTFIPIPEDKISELNPENYIKVKATIAYRIRRHNDEYVSKALVNEYGDYINENGEKVESPVIKDEFKIIKTSDFSQPLIEGSRYYVVLTFTSEAVSINIITAAAWDDKTVDFELV